MMKQLVRFLAGVVPLIAASAYAGNPHYVSDEPATLSIGLFSRPLPVIVAQSKGFYAKYHLSVTTTVVANSVEQFKDLKSGKYQIVMTSADNVVNYHENANTALGSRLDVTMIAGQDNGANLSLIAQPEIKTIADLRGKKIAVDAPNSGFAFVIYKMLRTAGLERGRDYTVVSSGGTATRFTALLARQFDATLLNSGFDVRAVATGRNRLATVADVVNPYMGISIAGRESWLSQNEDVVIRFLKAYYEALQWSFDPANREEGITIIQSGTPGMTRAVATEIYELLLKENVGLIADASVDRPGLYNILVLRQEFNGFDDPRDFEMLSAPAGGLFTKKYLKLAIWGLRDGE